MVSEVSQLAQFTIYLMLITLFVGLAFSAMFITIIAVMLFPTWRKRYRAHRQAGRHRRNEELLFTKEFHEDLDEIIQNLPGDQSAENNGSNDQNGV